MDLYNHRLIHNNPRAWFVRKTFLMKQWSRLGSLNIYRRFIPINLVKHWRSFIFFEKRKTMNMFTSSSKNSDDGLKASYISLLIAKAGKPHTIGEEPILPAVKEVIKTVLHKSPKQVIKSIPLSDNSVQRWVDKMAENVEETLSKMLMATEFILQLDESTLPGNESLLLTYIRFIKVTMSKVIVCTSPGNRYQRRISVSSCGGLFLEKKAFHLQTSSHVQQMAPRPWLVAPVDF